MKSVRRLFEVLCSAEHLERSARACTRGKRRRPDVAWFLFRREAVLARIERELGAGTWRPQRFELLYVHDPKPRVIARAPLEDRVVHTALVLLLEPVFEPSWTADDFACRRGLGTHRALLRLLELVRRHRFALHLDVRSYFPSIDLDVLRGLLARRVRDERFLGVVERVLVAGAGLYDAPRARAHARIDPDWPPRGRGLPIGALTSQLFAAHVYLNALDHFVRRELEVPGYVRYVDDLYVFGDGRRDLRRWRTEIGAWLARERGLRLKVPEARILSCAGHVDALGHRLTRAGIEPLPGALARLRARARRACDVRGGAKRSPDLKGSMASSVGHLLFGC